MSARELAVMEALNIASTVHGRKPRPGDAPLEDFQATAEQVRTHLETDPRVGECYAPSIRGMGTRKVAATLTGLLRRGRPYPPLVERAGYRRWRLTETGARAMLA
jgi:hypothetical protein